MINVIHKRPDFYKIFVKLSVAPYFLNLGTRGGNTHKPILFHFVLPKDTGPQLESLSPQQQLIAEWVENLYNTLFFFFTFAGRFGVVRQQKKLPMAWLLLRETMHLRRCGYMF